MQKKLLAVAVAGALAAPVAAMAQTTATIYGTISTSVETRSATGADTSLAATNTSSLRGAAGAAGALTATPADLNSRFNTQGAGSNFGIRVREDLGGGLYTWAQLELAAQLAGITPIASTTGGTAPTYRNSALALGSNAWGDILIGMWDSPFNVNMNPAPQHAAYGNASTSFSSQVFGGGPWGPQTNSGQTIAAMCNSTTGLTFTSTAQTCLAQSLSFHRRVSNAIQYWSPSWSGFQLKAIVQVNELKQAQNQTNGATSVNPNLWGGSLSYASGPLYVGVGYERHNDYTAIGMRTFGGGTGMNLGGAAGTAQFANIPGLVGAGGVPAGIKGSKDTAWNFNARYTFGAFTIGAYYEQLKWTMDYEGTLAGGEVTQLKKKAYGLEGAWVGGPHTVGIRYAKAKNLEGSTAAVGAVGGNPDFGGTGGNTWLFGYAYSLSKRTSLFGYHVRMTNETNARYSGIVFGGAAAAAGADPRYTGVGIRHTF